MDQREFKDKDVPTPGIVEDSRGLGRSYLPLLWGVVFFRYNHTD
jgi:hypothetical protein